MIHKIECVQGTCDNCGETFIDEHSGFSIYHDNGDLVQEMDNHDWYTGDTDPEHDGKHYCPDCFKYDPDIDDKIIVDETRKKKSSYK